MSKTLSTASYILIAQMHFTVLIVFAKLTFQHRTSEYNLSVTKCLLQNFVKKCVSF